MPTDPNMTGLIYPEEDDDADTWDTIMNTTCWPVIGAHDHTTGNGVKIPSAALKINADVSWAFSGTNYAITDALALDFAPQEAASVASYSSALFVNSDDANNLYFRNASGSNVKITDGSTLNVSIVGGIGGDYSSVSALLDYDDATDTYRFRQETSASVRQYAKISVADIIIREYDAAGDATVPTETVTLKSPDALAASYSLTMPAALPASTSLVRCNSTGQLAASGEIDESPTFATDRNVTLQGTGRVIHGDRIKVMPVTPGGVNVQTGTVSSTGGTAGAQQGVSTTAYYPIIFGFETSSDASIGERFQSVIAFVSASGGSPTYTLMRSNSFDGTFTAVSSADATSSSSPTITVTSPAVATIGNAFWLRVVTDGSTTVDIYSMAIEADRV